MTPTESPARLTSEKKMLPIAEIKKRIDAVHADGYDIIEISTKWLSELLATAEELDRAEAKLKQADEILTLVLPLAIGYAHAHPVGSNSKYCDLAIDFHKSISALSARKETT